MQRKVSKEKFYYAGKSKTTQDLVHQHMSNHYRKILNAKKAVDNNPPLNYKAKRPATSNAGVVKNKVNRQLESPALTDRSISTNSNKGSCWGTESYAGSSRYHARCIPESPAFGGSNKNYGIDMELVNRITYDTKKGPASYCGEGWTDGKSQHNDKEYKTVVNMKQNAVQKSSSPTTKRRLPTISSQESAHKRKFAVQQENENPSNEAITSPLDITPYKCSKIALDDTSDTVLKKISFNPKEQSLTSSRDSAYNGGVSSLPESRSPTPDERKKKECCCCCCEKKSGKLMKSESKIVEDKETVKQQQEQPSEIQEDVLKKLKEDQLYVKFIQDITTEVLEKNLYTNKALKNVMKKHIKNNLVTLNKDRMLKEVEYLQTQLGIPQDETILQLDGNTEETEIDCTKYQIISDSEFSMPKLTNSNKKIPTATTDESDSSKPPIREEKLIINFENSSSDSDHSILFKNYKKKFQTSDSSSSSDSEIFINKVWNKTTKGETSEREEILLQGFCQDSKKNRNVSFWNDSDLVLTRTGRTVEIKHKKTIVRDKESVSSVQEKKEKAKND